MSREAAMRHAMAPRPCGKTAPMHPAAISEDRQLIRLSYRIRRLPVQLEATRKRLQALEAEARELGMLDLLENT